MPRPRTATAAEADVGHRAELWAVSGAGRAKDGAFAAGLDARTPDTRRRRDGTSIERTARRNELPPALGGSDDDEPSFEGTLLRFNVYIRVPRRLAFTARREKGDWRKGKEQRRETVGATLHDYKPNTGPRRQRCWSCVFNCSIGDVGPRTTTGLGHTSRC